jgi:anoctamin-8
LGSLHYWFLLLVSPCLYGAFIPLLDAVWTKVASALTRWENHRTESKHQSHLILKVFSFRFINVFSSLYYYAFSQSLLQLAVQLAAFMLLSQVGFNGLMDTYFPWVLHRLRKRWRRKKLQQTLEDAHVAESNPDAAAAAMKSAPRSAACCSVWWCCRLAPLCCRQCSCSSSSSASAMAANVASSRPRTNRRRSVVKAREMEARSSVWEEAQLPSYNTFSDYTQMLIQFGYVSFFSMTFPLGTVTTASCNHFCLQIFPSVCVYFRSFDQSPLKCVYNRP